MNGIDTISEHILRELTRDGRISNLELADRVGLSPSACLRRVQGLQTRGGDQGIPCSAGPHGDWGGLRGLHGVGLSDHSKAAQEAFEKAISKAPEVRECHNITGTIEYLLRVECADLPAYKHFHTDKLGALAKVASITSYVVMGSPKEERA